MLERKLIASSALGILGGLPFPLAALLVDNCVGQLETGALVRRVGQFVV